MALSYDQLTATTKKYFIPTLVDNIFNSNPVFWTLYQKGSKERGGERIIQPLVYAANSTVGSYSGYDVLDTSPTEEISAAEFNWKQYYANVTIDGLSKLKNAGDSAVVDLLASKVQIAEHSLRNKLGTDLFSDGTGNGSKELTGLKAAVDAGATVATYGGIARGTYTWWQSTVDTSTTTLSLGVMQTMDGATTVDSDSTDMIVTTQALYNAFWVLLQPQQRFADDAMAKAGFKNLLFNGKPLCVDSHCPASHMWFLNTNYLDLITHSDQNFEVVPFQKPINQDAVVSQILWAGNLVGSNCRMHGKFTGLTG